jgi:ATP-dependent Clp protease protease subunit
MFFAKANGKRGEIYIYEDIGEGWFGGITAKSFSDSMKELGKVDALDIYINSAGGSVFDGIAIYNQIKRFSGEKIVHVDGIAASIASVIAMAGDEVRIAENGMIMIHKPWGMSVGTADDMRKYADSLDKVNETILDTYVAKTGKDKAMLSGLMDAETWLNANEALELGFATSKTDSKMLKAESQLFAKFKNVPETIRKQAMASNVLLARMEMRSKSLGVNPKTA